MDNLKGSPCLQCLLWIYLLQYGVTCESVGECVARTKACLRKELQQMCIRRECDGNPCLNGGVCKPGLHPNNTIVYMCTCQEGYEGERCEINIDDCALDPCLNGGSCVDGISQYTCECPETTTGLNCESEIVCIKSNYSAATAQYLFDGTTSGFGALSYIAGFDYSADGLSIALAESTNNRVYILDPTLNYISSFASAGGPSDVAYGSDGLLYVAHFNGNDVKVYNESGVLQRSISGGFSNPTGIEADGGLLYIAQYNGGAIHVYQEDGTLVTQITDGLGSLQPMYMTLHDGNIYATGNGGSIVVFNSSYEVIKTYTALQPPFNVYLGGIDIDSDGTMIIGDRSNNVVLIVDSNDVVQGSLGSAGTGPGQFTNPRLTSFTPDGDIVILDDGNDRLHIFVVPCN